jgi:PadR family transcriptional regulator, regulatory protein PadR
MRRATSESAESSVRGHLELLLLASLSATPSHGYALIESLQILSGGAFELAEGSLYPVLHKLEHVGLVRSAWDRESGRRRRVYRITGAGRRELEERSRRWRVIRDAVDSVLSAAADAGDALGNPRPSQSRSEATGG